jgi:integrase
VVNARDEPRRKVPAQPAVLRLVETAAPNAVNETIRPKRVANAERRAREHLSREEVLALIKAARVNRHGVRDAAAIWLSFNHGLRVSELADLRWSDVNPDLLLRPRDRARYSGAASAAHKPDANRFPPHCS